MKKQNNFCIPTPLLFLVIGIMMLFTIIASAPPTSAYTSHSEITVVRQMPSQALAGETIAIEITLNVGTGISDPIKGLFFTDEIPEGLTIEQGSFAATLNGDDLTNTTEEIGTEGVVYPAAVPYRLILEIPPDFTENNPLTGGDELILTYDVTIPNDASTGTVYTFPGYNWVARLLANPVEDIFGYEDSPGITLTVISSSPTTSSSTTSSIPSQPSTTTTVEQTTTTTAIISTSTTTTEQPIPEYIVVLSPPSATLNFNETLTFAARTILDGEEVDGGIYEWEISFSDDIGSTVTDGVYTAGLNLSASDIVEYLVVRDIAHEDAMTQAEITVLSETQQGVITRVFPNNLLCSYWLPMPYFLFIMGDETHFDSTSVVSFNPGEGILTMGQIGFENLLVALIILEPGLNEGMVDLMVTTGEGEDEVVVFEREAITIKPLPLSPGLDKFKIKTNDQ